VRFDEAGAQIEASLGPSPELANVWINKATALNRLGRHDEVIPTYERALAILEKTPDKLALATTLNNLGEIYYNREVFDASRRYYERSLKIAEDILGSDHPDLAFPLVGLARVLDSENRHRESIEMYERVIRIVSESLGPHRLSAVAYNGIAQVHAEEKRWNEALAALDRETEMVAKMPHVRVDDRLTLATVRVEVLYARGDPAPAIPELVKWVERAHAEGVEASRVGESELSLAQAQAMAGQTADARKTVAAALAHLESAPAAADRVPIARALKEALGD
jgi:tetratricopeptide (TPR) repeat protein